MCLPDVGKGKVGSLAKCYSSYLEYSRNFWKFLGPFQFFLKFDSSFFQVQKIPVFSSSGFHQKLEISGNARAILESIQDSGNFQKILVWEIFQKLEISGNARAILESIQDSGNFQKILVWEIFQKLEISGMAEPFLKAFKILEISRKF